MPYDDVYTTAEVADASGFPEADIRALARTGAIEAFKTPQGWLISERGVEDAIAMAESVEEDLDDEEELRVRRLEVEINPPDGEEDRDYDYDE